MKALKKKPKHKGSKTMERYIVVVDRREENVIPASIKLTGNALTELVGVTSHAFKSVGPARAFATRQAGQGYEVRLEKRTLVLDLDDFDPNELQYSDDWTVLEETLLSTKPIVVSWDFSGTREYRSTKNKEYAFWVGERNLYGLKGLKMGAKPILEDLAEWVNYEAAAIVERREILPLREEPKATKSERYAMTDKGPLVVHSSLSAKNAKEVAKVKGYSVKRWYSMLRFCRVTPYKGGWTCPEMIIDGDDVTIKPEGVTMYGWDAAKEVAVREAEEAATVPMSDEVRAEIPHGMVQPIYEDGVYRGTMVRWENETGSIRRMAQFSTGDVVADRVAGFLWCRDFSDDDGATVYYLFDGARWGGC